MAGSRGLESECIYVPSEHPAVPVCALGAIQLCLSRSQVGPAQLCLPGMDLLGSGAPPASAPPCTQGPGWRGDHERPPSSCSSILPSLLEASLG